MNGKNNLRRFFYFLKLQILFSSKSYQELTVNFEIIQKLLRLQQRFALKLTFARFYFFVIVQFQFKMAMQARQSTSKAAAVAAAVVQDEEDDDSSTNIPISKLEVRKEKNLLTNLF